MNLTQQFKKIVELMEEKGEKFVKLELELEQVKAILFSVEALDARLVLRNEELHPICNEALDRKIVKAEDNYAAIKKNSDYWYECPECGWIGTTPLIWPTQNLCPQCYGVRGTVETKLRQKARL